MKRTRIVGDMRLGREAAGDLSRRAEGQISPRTGAPHAPYSAGEKLRRSMEMADAANHYYYQVGSKQIGALLCGPEATSWHGPCIHR